MRIQPINTNTKNTLPTSYTSTLCRKINNIAFRANVNPRTITSIENEILEKYGVSCIFGMNRLLAEKTEKTIQIFNDLFGKESLPKVTRRRTLDSGIAGIYNAKLDEVAFSMHSSQFKSEFMLRLHALRAFNLLMPNDMSSLHPAHVFNHEFGHSAHWHHLVARHGEEDAIKVWTGLEGYTIPDAIGRLIIRYKLGNYAIDSKDMCEFMSERIAQDICKKQTIKTWELTGKPDVGYEDIFTRKWNYRYTNPQSYLDYFTQQVWNGDTEEAIIAAQKIDYFLKLVDEGRAVEEAIAYQQEVDPPHMRTFKVTQLKPIEPVESVHPSVQKRIEAAKQRISSAEEAANQMQTRSELLAKLSPLERLVLLKNEQLTQYLDQKNRTLLKL